MRVLIAYESRHGGTRGIANRLADGLRERGIVADVRQAEAVQNLAPYAAVILGSAVCMGRWMPGASRFLERFEAPLGDLPLWIFSSGPLGDSGTPGETPVTHQQVLSVRQVRGHRIFHGRLDPHGLGFAERLVAKSVHAPAGDFRDWRAIAAWADEIGREVAQGPQAPGEPEPQGMAAEERIL